MKLPVKNLKGEEVGEVELPSRIWEVEVSQPLMHQALLRQNANAHLGTHSVQTRADVNRTTKKAFAQKGTGRARAGSMKAPQWRGGGVAFGPHPHSYYQSMPKRMRRAAVRCALSQKLSDQEIIVVDNYAMEAPKTKDLMIVLQTLGVNKALLVLPGRNPAIELSARNIENVKTLFASYLNIRDIFMYDKLVVSLDALTKIEEWLG